MRISDWSSDVCSSDLWAGDPVVAPADRRGVTPVCDPLTLTIAATTVAAVGKGYSALVQSAQARGVEAQARVNQREANASAIDALDRANQEQVRPGRHVAGNYGGARSAREAEGIRPGL